MLCKFCGMDSASTDVCSFCGHSLKTVEAEPVAAPSGGNTRPVFVEADAEVMEEATETQIGAVPSLNAPTAPVIPSSAKPQARPPAPGVPSGGKGRAPAPAMPAPQAGHASISAILAGTANAPRETTASAPILVDNPAAATLSLSARADAMLTGDQPEVAARPLAAVDEVAEVSAETGIGSKPAFVSAAPTATPAEEALADEKRRVRAASRPIEIDEPNASVLLGRYLGVFAVIVLLTVGLSFVGARLYVVPMLIAMFVSALLLPVMRVVPWVEEDSDDVAWFVILTLIFGPLVALIIYSVVGLMRQTVNAAVLGCLAVAAVVRITAELASKGVLPFSKLFSIMTPFTNVGHLDSSVIKLLLLNWSGFVALAGWYAASSFHKEDE